MRYLFFAVTVLLCLRCRQPIQKPAESESNPTVCIDQAKAVDDLEPFIRSIEVICLDTTIISVGTNKIVTYQDRFITDALVEFDMTGKMTQKYGQLGRGPGEYLHIIDYCIDLSGKELLCLNHRNAILRYSLGNASFLGSIETGIQGITAKAVLPLSGGRFALFFPNPPTAKLAELETPFYCLKIFNSRGKLIGEDLLREDFYMSLFRAPATQMAGNEYTLCFSSGTGQAWMFSADGYEPILTIDLGEKALPKGYAINREKNPWDAVESIFEQDYIKSPTALCVTDSWVYFSAFGEGSSVWNYLIPKTGGPGIKWRSIGKEAPPMIGLASDEDGVFFCMAESSVSAMKDPLARVILSRLGMKLTESDNSVIAKVSFNI